MGAFDDLIPTKGNFDDLIPKSEEPSFLSKIGTGMSEMAKAESEGGRAAGETALSLGTGTAAAVVSPIAGAITRVKNPIFMEGAAEQAKKVKEGTAELMTYQPKSEGGKAIIDALSPYISLPSILGNILERDESTAKNFGKGLPLDADKVTGTVASILRDIGEPARQALGGGTVEDLAKTVLEFYGYTKVGKVKDTAVKGAQFVKDRASLDGMKDVIQEAKGDTSIQPEIERSERVSPEFTKSVLEPADKTLQIEQKKDFVLADEPDSLIYKQAKMFEEGRKTKGTFDDLIPQKEAVKEPVGSFDDLIPRESKNVPIQEVPPEATVEAQAPPEIVKPVATSQAKTEIFADSPLAETVTKPSEAVSVKIESPLPTEKPTLPEAEGELKPHRTAQRVEDVVSKEPFGEDIAKYTVEEGMIKAEEAKGDAIVAQGYESAVNDLFNGVTPEGVRPGTMIGAVSREAYKRGDADTIWKLGTDKDVHTPAEEIAKDLKSFDQGLTNDPVTAIRSVVKARQEENVRTGVSKVDPVKMNAEVERLGKLLEETQKKLDEQIVNNEIKRTPKTYGTANKLVTKSEYLKVKEELRVQLGSQLNAVLDPTIAAKLAKIGTYHLEAGAREFAVWSKRVVDDVGEWAKPHLEDVWKQSNETVGSKKDQVNLSRYKTRLQNESEKYAGKLESVDLVKAERKKTVLDAEGRKLKDQRDKIKKAYDTAVRKTGTITRDEASELLRLAKNSAELKSKHDPSVTTNHGFPSERERLEYGVAQVAFERYVAALKEGDQSLASLTKRRAAEFKTDFQQNKVKAFGKLGIDLLGEISDSSIALVASLDNSFIGRQGLITLQTHPTVWAKAAMKSFSDIYKALRDKHGNEVAKDILHADLVSKENYINGNYRKSGILAKFEEQYPTSHPSRVPYLGRAFKASEVAFTNTALRMRIGTFDLLLDMAKKDGLTIDKAMIEDIGSIVNAATARAKSGNSKLVRNLLWAPKMVAANINVLTVHGGTAGLHTAFAKKQAAYNLMKIVGETAAVVAVINALDPGSVELDPRSSDFMKYRRGNTRIDLTAGRGQYITLAGRFLTGQTKNAQTKIIKELDLAGFGNRTYFDVGLDFLINKTTPTVRAGIYFAKGRNFEGKQPTIASTIIDMTTPIPVKNVADDTFGDYSDDRAIVMMGNLADVFGVNANTYQQLDQWEGKKSEKMVTLKRRLGEERFERLNIKYNKLVNDRIDKLVERPEYQRLSDENKEKEIMKLKRQVKESIIGK